MKKSEPLSQPDTTRYTGDAKKKTGAKPRAKEAGWDASAPPGPPPAKEK